MANDLPILIRISVVEKEVNRLSALFRKASGRWEDQMKAFQLKDQLEDTCENLAKLYAERDADIIAAKLAELRDKMSNRSAVTGSNLPLKFVGPEKSGKQKLPNVPRRAARVDEIMPGKPVKIISKAKRRQQQVA